MSIMNNFELSKYEKALEYEILVKKEYSFLDKYIYNSKIIFDVGSHLGFFSRYVLNLSSPEKIYLFEPSKCIYERSKVYLSNHSNLVFNNCWLYSSDKTACLYLSTDKSMQNSLYNNTFLNVSSELESIKLIRLDKYLVDNNVNKIDLLKIDAEWAEREIIKWISKKYFSKINCVFLEYHLFWQYSLEDIVSMMSSDFNLVLSNSSKYTDRLWYMIFKNKLEI